MWNKEQKIAISLIKEIEEVGKEWDILFNFYRDVPRKKILMEIYYIQYYAVVDAVNACSSGHRKVNPVIRIRLKWDR